MVDILLVLLGSSVRYRDSIHLLRQQMTNLFHPIITALKVCSLFINTNGNLILTSLTSLMSPTSRCLESSPPVPLVSAGPKVAPAPTGGHRDEIVPDPNPPSAKKINKKYQIKLKFTFPMASLISLN